MISKQEQLINKGFLQRNNENSYANISFNKKLQLLKSKIPSERTLAARLLTNDNNNNSIKYLIEALKVENKLYSKIEISNAIISFDKESVKPLINILGEVGNNQHKKVPEKEFKKSSYPLPRDIAARTIIRIGKVALQELINVLKTNNKKQISEVIDAIGYICFYDYQTNIYYELVECYSNNIENDLIKWKILRAMSSFPESIEFLNKEKKNIKNIRLLKEIERSNKLIEKIKL